MEVGFIGTGLMGLPMAQRVAQAGFPLIVYNRTVEKLEPLKAVKVAIAATPDAVIYASRCVVLMLTNAAAIQDVILSKTAQRALAGKTILQMGTIAPSESQEIHQAVVAVGGNYVEAPVLGSIPEAKSGTLQVMVGGTAAQFDQLLPLLKCFGPEPQLIGPVGSAAAVKLALNQLIGTLTTGFATSLGFMQRHHVSVDAFMHLLRKSALYAPTFDKKLQRMLDRNYANPNFPTRHLLKDMSLFLSEAEKLRLRSDVVTAVKTILEQTEVEGWADADYSALFSTVTPPETDTQDDWPHLLKRS
mgnify:CR=1 FL=1